MFPGSHLAAFTALFSECPVCGPILQLCRSLADPGRVPTVLLLSFVGLFHAVLWLRESDALQGMDLGASSISAALAPGTGPGTWRAFLAKK